jgi:CCR4-NOT transcription complex subunit 6
VKLMQTQLLIEEVQKLLPRHMKIPTILCGDFNSTPDSGVWEFLQKGHLPASHAGGLYNQLLDNSFVKLLM